MSAVRKRMTGGIQPRRMATYWRCEFCGEWGGALTLVAPGGICPDCGDADCPWRDRWMCPDCCAFVRQRGGRRVRGAGRRLGGLPWFQVIRAGTFRRRTIA